MGREMRGIPDTELPGAEVYTGSRLSTNRATASWKVVRAAYSPSLPNPSQTFFPV